MLKYRKPVKNKTLGLIWKINNLMNKSKWKNYLEKFSWNKILKQLLSNNVPKQKG